jgi:hypothetical protein
MNNWIKVSDRLPEVNQEVIIYPFIYVNSYLTTVNKMVTAIFNGKDGIYKICGKCYQRENVNTMQITFYFSLLHALLQLWL